MPETADDPRAAGRRAFERPVQLPVGGRLETAADA